MYGYLMLKSPILSIKTGAHFVSNVLNKKIFFESNNVFSSTTINNPTIVIVIQWNLFIIVCFNFPLESIYLCLRIWDMEIRRLKFKCWHMNSGLCCLGNGNLRKQPQMNGFYWIFFKKNLDLNRKQCLMNSANTDSFLIIYTI